MFRLTRSQKSAIFIFFIGTISSFGLVIYLNIDNMYNGLFFPSHAESKEYLHAFIFFFVFIIRLLAAFIIGYIGDNVGRTTVLTVTVGIVALCCMATANVKTYGQIGVWAAVIIVACRGLQGVSYFGEPLVASVCLSEMITERKTRYLAVSSITVAIYLAHVIAYVMLLFISNSWFITWRFPFWCGIGVAIMIPIIRSNLKETREYTYARNIALKRVYEYDRESKIVLNNNNFLTPMLLKTSIAYFFIYIGKSLSYYFTYMYLPKILITKFGYNATQIATHNLLLSTFDLSRAIIFGFLSYKIFPIKIMKWKLNLFLLFLIILPFSQSEFTTWHQICIVQIIICAALDSYPAEPIFYKAFPVLKRITSIGVIQALANLLVCVIMSITSIYFELANTNTFLSIMLPIAFCSAVSVRYFEKLVKHQEN